MEKTVLVRLRAEMGRYKADLSEGVTATRSFGRELSGAGKTGRADLDQIARGSTVAGAAVAAGFGLAIHATMGFDSQLSELGAVSSATAGEMDKLRDAALDAGAKTVFSASEAALAQTELSKAGVATADILGGALTGALDLAAAGGLELGQAAEIAAGAMGTFDLAGRDVTHVADVLAAGANKSAADVDELAMAMSQSGLVAAQYGLGLEDTVGVLALFAQNQLRGSDAGTSFKTMLQRLTPTSKEAADKMAELGIDMFDAQGNFIGISAAAGELHDGLSSLTQEQRNTALATIFGSDAVRAATILYEEGADGVDEWIAKVDDAGFASDVAAQRLDNLSGDLEGLRGSIETALIKGGSEATSALRFMAQGATQTVNGFTELPGPIQGAGMALTGLAGAGALAVGGIAYLGPRIEAAKTALEGMGTAGEFASRNMGKFALGLGIAGVAVAAISYIQGENAQQAAEAEAATKGFADAIRSAGDAATGTGNQIETLLSDTPELAELMEGTGTSVEELQAALMGSDAEFERFKDGLIDSAEGAGLSNDALATLVFGLDGLRGAAQGGAEDAENLDSVLGDTGETAAAVSPEMEALGDSIGMTGEEAEAATKAVKDYQDTLRAGVDPVFAMADALRGNADAQDAYTAALQANSDGFADADVSQRELDSLLQDVGSSALDVEVAASELAAAMIEGGASSDQFTDQLNRWVEQGAITQEQANLLAWQFGGVADNADRVDGGRTARLYGEDHASPVIDALNAKLQDLRNRSTIHRIQVQIDNPSGRALGFQLSAGGMVPQAPIYRAMGGPSGTDTVPMWATPGEYVMRAAAVDHWGAGTFAAMNAGMAPPALAPMMYGSGGGTTVINNYYIQASTIEERTLGRVVVDSILAAERRGVARL